jgi:chorismate mutase
MARASSGRVRRRTGRSADPMAVLRRRIDALDRRLVTLLNERARHAIALGLIKKQRGLPVYQPSREEEVLRNVRGGNGGPLEDGALQRLFERIIDESRSIERHTTEAKGRVPSDPSPRPDDGAGETD